MQVGSVGGFAKFPDAATGLKAARVIVTTLAPSYGYGRILAMAGATHTPHDQARAIERSSWAAGHYGSTATLDGSIARQLTTTPPVVEKPPVTSTPSIAPLVPVDMGAPSPDTVTYLQQLFTIESDPAKYAVLAGSWPSEATNDTDRPFAIAQFVSSIVGSGPHYTPDPLLSNAQVRWAAAKANANNGTWNINPVYFAALNRADEVASRHPAEAPLPWAHEGATQPVMLCDTGTFGVTPVSGYYGTGHGTLK